MSESDFQENPATDPDLFTDATAGGSTPAAPDITPAPNPAGRLLIVDGHAYAYRAFFAIPHLSSPSGAPTNAIYGFVKMLAKLQAALHPTYQVVIWDGGLAAERLAALPDYKAQRPAMPGDLEQQLDPIVEYLAAARVASRCREGVEADDWIATLTRHACNHGLQTVIASSDKDFMQLVSPCVGLVNPNDKSPTVWSTTQVQARTGVMPAQIVDWLSLIGDTVDNIRGVPGVGPKTAAQLLQQFGSVTTMYERLDQVKADRLHADLRAAEPVVRRNLTLIRLNDSLPVEVDLAALATAAPDIARLRALYARWGFKSLSRELELSVDNAALLC